jgi:hypothetical protein
MHKTKLAALFSVVVVCSWANAEMSVPKDSGRTPTSAFTTGTFKTSFKESVDCSKN